MCIVSEVQWLVYDLEKPQNMAFDVNVSSLAYVEEDNFRQVQIEYLIGKLFEEDD